MIKRIMNSCWLVKVVYVPFARSPQPERTLTGCALTITTKQERYVDYCAIDVIQVSECCRMILSCY